MATNDFTQDLLSKLNEEKIEYLVITIQKGKEAHKSSAHFNINTVDGLDMIATTVDQVFQRLGDDDLPTDLELEIPPPEDDSDDECEI